MAHRSIWTIAAGLISTACGSLAERAVERNAANTVHLGRYCASLQEGQAWTPEALEAGLVWKRLETTSDGEVIEVQHPNGVSRCRVTTTIGRIAALSYISD